MQKHVDSFFLSPPPAALYFKAMNAKSVQGCKKKLLVADSMADSTFACLLFGIHHSFHYSTFFKFLRLNLRRGAGGVGEWVGGIVKSLEPLGH